MGLHLPVCKFLNVIFYCFVHSLVWIFVYFFCLLLGNCAEKERLGSHRVALDQHFAIEYSIWVKISLLGSKKSPKDGLMKIEGFRKKTEGERKAVMPNSPR
jgi:hypothetical protein